MDEPKKILTVHIGKTDIFEWAIGSGKDILMPELLVGCEELLYNDLDDVMCLRVETEIRGNQKAFDFSVKAEGVHDTLDKIMKWALENEEYESCSRVRDLLEHINNKQF